VSETERPSRLERAAPRDWEALEQMEALVHRPVSLDTCQVRRGRGLLEGQDQSSAQAARSWFMVSASSMSVPSKGRGSHRLRR
jgi:hypothetical protein